MYVHSLTIKNLGIFSNSTIEFLYPGKNTGSSKIKYPNVNLLLGDNGAGKSTLIRAVALTALGPTVEGAGIYSNNMVRDTTKFSPAQYGAMTEGEADINAEIVIHPEDVAGQDEKNETSEKDFPRNIHSNIKIIRRSEFESIRFQFAPQEEDLWKGIYSYQTHAFLMVGYGATRRVEAGESLDMGARGKSRHIRAQRVQGLFEESYSLIPLTYWMPALETQEPERFQQFSDILNNLLEKENYRFTGKIRGTEYLYEKNGAAVPFQAMSDGYRAFIGWISDLLYHINYGCPPGKDIAATRGVAIVDEVDLHLHPKWQMKVIASLAGAFPNIQFVFSSHSPLITGSLEWMNIIYMKGYGTLNTRVEKIEKGVHGLDADQVLLSDFFGLTSTRSDSQRRKLKDLTLKARSGDDEAAEELLKYMTHGAEDTK